MESFDIRLLVLLVLKLCMGSSMEQASGSTLSFACFEVCERQYGVPLDS